MQTLTQPRTGVPALITLAVVLIAGLLAVSPVAEPADALTKCKIAANKIALDAQEQTFLTLINQHRDDHGLQPLQSSETLNRSSAWMAKDMAKKNYFSHVDKAGRDPFKRMRNCGYGGTAMAENIAAGNATAQATFLQWKNSPGHNENMLNPAYRYIGIARHYGGDSRYGWYWVTNFGNTAN